MTVETLTHWAMLTALIQSFAAAAMNDITTQDLATFS